MTKTNLSPAIFRGFLFVYLCICVQGDWGGLQSVLSSTRTTTLKLKERKEDWVKPALKILMCHHWKGWQVLSKEGHFESLRKLFHLTPVFALIWKLIPGCLNYFLMILRGFRMKNGTWLTECRTSAVMLHCEVSQSDLSSSAIP